MGTYRQSRNIEATCIERIETILTDNNYTGVNVEKSFARVYSIDLPVICVRVGDTIHSGVEIGSHLTKRKPLILIDVFANSDGQRLDLSNLLVSNLKQGFDYVEYVIVNGEISTRTTNGRIIVESIDDHSVDLGVDKSQLDVHDRYRHLITIHASKSSLET